VAVDIGYRGNMKKRMSRANESGARYAVIVGENELSAGRALVRNLQTGTQTPQPFSLFGKIPLSLMDGQELGEQFRPDENYIADLLKDFDKQGDQ
jgi:histidyl-tRNA synthetase